MGRFLLIRRNTLIMFKYNGFVFKGTYLHRALRDGVWRYIVRFSDAEEVPFIAASCQIIAYHKLTRNHYT